MSLVMCYIGEKTFLKIPTDWFFFYLLRKSTRAHLIEKGRILNWIIWSCSYSLINDHMETGAIF